MEELELRFGSTKEQAREHPSLGLVYVCPKCKVGAKLVHASTIRDTVRCNSCNTEYKKP